MNLFNIVKNKIDEYLEFDSDLIFTKCDRLEIFGGAVRDSISNNKINDIDILSLPQSSYICDEILQKNGYQYLNSLNGKDFQSLYLDIQCIFEPRTYINKNNKIVQIIRPNFQKPPSDKLFLDSLREVDLSCCGVSFNGKVIKENCPNSIEDCKNMIYTVYKNNKMYNESRFIQREQKLIDRGWKKK